VDAYDVIFIGNWLEEKKLAPVAGFDLVFSTPNSVSGNPAATRRPPRRFELILKCRGARIRESNSEAHQQPRRDAQSPP
jgi:hypothetical protein